MDRYIRLRLQYRCIHINNDDDDDDDNDNNNNNNNNNIILTSVCAEF